MRVFVSRRILPAGLDVLREAGLEVRVHDSDIALDHVALKEAVSGCDGLLCMLNDRIDPSILNSPGLRVVANHAVGVDNIDLKTASELGIVVTNTPGVLTDATADLTMALLLSTARRVVEADEYARQGRFQGWAPSLFVGASLQGKTLGIVGMGRIGTAVARRAEAFGMRILSRRSSGGVDLDTLLAESDFLTLHCPLSERTHHLFNREAFRKMKRSAILINTARGPVVCEEDLVWALNEGEIAAAGLDVFEEEPTIHPGLLGLPQVVLLPHIGSADLETRDTMAKMAAKSIVDVLEGRRPSHPV